MKSAEARTKTATKQVFDQSEAINKALRTGGKLPKHILIPHRSDKLPQGIPASPKPPKRPDYLRDPLTKNERLLYRALPAGALALALTAGVGLATSEVIGGGESLPAHAKALKVKMQVNGEQTGVNLHSSPNTAPNPDDVTTSDNVVDRVEPGHSFTIIDPLVAQKTDNFGNPTVWYGFKDPKINQQVWVNGTQLAGDQIVNGVTYISAEPRDGSSNIDLLSPDSSSETNVHLDQGTNQYMLGGKPVAVGMPSLTKQLSLK